MVSSLSNSTTALFLGDVPDVTYSGVSGTLAVVLKVMSGSSVLVSVSESYTPDLAGNVLLQGLQDLLKFYVMDAMAITIPASANKNFPNIRLNIVAYDGDAYISHDIRIYPSMGAVGADPADYRLNFTQQRNRVCHWSEPQMVALNMKLSHSLGLAYMKEGKYKWVTKPLPAVSYDYCILNVSAYAMMSFMAVQDEGVMNAVYSAIESRDADGNITDTVRIDYTPELRNEGVCLLHANYFGLPEVFACYGQDKEKQVMDASFGYIRGKYRRFDNRNGIEHVTDTGWLDKERYAALQDLLMSPQVFVVSFESPVQESPVVGREITITDVDAVIQKPNRELRHAALTYRYADKNCRAADSVPVIVQRIFDSSFNTPFE